MNKLTLDSKIMREFERAHGVGVYVHVRLPSNEMEIDQDICLKSLEVYWLCISGIIAISNCRLGKGLRLRGEAFENNS